MRSTFVTTSLAFLFGLACLVGSASANAHPNPSGNGPEAFLADPASLIYDHGASVVMIGADDAREYVPSGTSDKDGGGYCPNDKGGGGGRHALLQDLMADRDK